jgi:uncharacterized membrane protein YedE/YeeE
MTYLILGLGFLFGAILQWGRLNRFDTISGMATLEDFAVAKALMVAIGVGMILLNAEIALGGAAYHVKPFLLMGVAAGGILFGIGMAILGYCPGTLAVSLGEGSVDALPGIVGGLLGGLAFTLVQPQFQAISGPDLGKLSLYSLLGDSLPVFFPVVILLGAALVWGAFRLNRLEPAGGMRWLQAGLGLAVLNCVVFAASVTGRPIGASTSYPYLADKLAGATGNGYFAGITGSGHWELVFLLGAVLAGLVISLATGGFKVTLIHDRWLRSHGPSAGKRIGYALLGGFVMLFGARMAGGCTSGHVLSGGMQLAASSWVFALFVFAGLLVTGKLFYRR